MHVFAVGRRHKMYRNNCNSLSVNFQKKGANRVLHEIRGGGDYFQAQRSGVDWWKSSL